jgi:hypothetical protein
VPAPIVPDRLWMAELQAVARVIPGFVYGLGAAGAAVAQGGADESFPSRGFSRVGLEVGDGQAAIASGERTSH